MGKMAELAGRAMANSGWRMAEGLGRIQDSGESGEVTGNEWPVEKNSEERIQDSGVQ